MYIFAEIISQEHKELYDMSNGNTRYFLMNLLRRHRISVTDENGREVWYSLGRPLRWGLYLLGAVVVIFVATLALSAYTPLLNIFPGYDGIAARERMIEQIIRLDSLERELDYMRVYTDNVAQVMEGRRPVVRSLTPTEQDRIASDKEIVAPSAMDSLLRSQMEGSGRYGIGGPTSDAKSAGAQILRPVDECLVAKGFSPSTGLYGVRLTVPESRGVRAVQAGTVILSTLEPDGYTVQIQHSAGFISTYRSLGEALKQTGERVEGGEAIGTTRSDITTEGGKREIEIQFWFDGVAVDPENYIVF